jgi:hypothetical protein
VELDPSYYVIVSGFEICLRKEHLESKYDLQPLLKRVRCILMVIVHGVMLGSCGVALLLMYIGQSQQEAIWDMR